MTDLDIILDEVGPLSKLNGGPVAPVIVSAADLYSMKIEPPHWVIEGILPAGLTILAGKPKSGKSWLCLDLALSVAAGAALFDQLPTGPACDVLCLFLEDTNYRIQTRMKKLLNGEQPPVKLDFCTEWPRSDQGGLDHLSDWVQDHKNAGLIIIDTLQMIRPESKKYVGIYEGDYKAANILKKLADEYKIAVVVVQHVRKAKSSDPMETVSGSTGLTGAADTICVLQRDPSTSNASLYIRGRDVGDTSLALLFDKDLARWRLFGEGGLPATVLQQQIVAAVTDKARTPAEIAELVDSSTSSIQNILKKLLDKGLILKSGYGRYVSSTYQLEQQI